MKCAKINFIASHVASKINYFDLAEAKISDRAKKFDRLRAAETDTDEQKPINSTFQKQKKSRRYFIIFKIVKI